MNLRPASNHRESLIQDLLVLENSMKPSLPVTATHRYPSNFSSNLQSPEPGNPRAGRAGSWSVQGAVEAPGGSTVAADGTGETPSSRTWNTSRLHCAGTVAPG
jgi:hypothetical protein